MSCTRHEYGNWSDVAQYLACKKSNVFLLGTRPQALEQTTQ